jgi:hypothetical protein
MLSMKSEMCDVFMMIIVRMLRDACMFVKYCKNQCVIYS